MSPPVMPANTPAQPTMTPMMQVIAVPAGAAPPPGAIPIDPNGNFTAPSGQSGQYPEETPQQSQKEKARTKAFKIRDPRTGEELQPTGDEGTTSRRPKPKFTIKDPKTGEEVLPA